MRLDSCRKCGVELEIKEYCKNCQQPLELECKNCNQITTNSKHFQCPSKSFVNA